MNDVVVQSAPLLANVPRVELGMVGTWNISNMSDWTPTPDDFASAIAALDCPAVRRPVLKFGHTGNPGEGDPSIGIIDNLALSEDKQVLLGDFVGVPGWLAQTDANGNSVLSSSYPDRSGEWEHNYTCQLGHTHPFVLHAMALLGVVRPGIGTLQSLYDIYAKAPEKDPLMAGIANTSVTPDQIRKAYYAGPAADDYNLYVREMFVDPPELIVQNDADDSLQRVAYTLTADGGVEFVDPVPVRVEYVAARASHNRPVVAFASSAESRPVINPVASAEQTESESPVSDLTEALRAKFGLPADATEADILAALNIADPAAPVEPEETAPVADPAPAAEPVAASASRTPGVVMIEASILDELRESAALGVQARQRQLQEDRERVVQTAISEGRIAPARKEHWLTALAADHEGATQALASLAPGLIPMSEIGTGVDGSAVAKPDNDLGWFDGSGATSKES